MKANSVAIAFALAVLFAGAATSLAYAGAVKIAQTQTKAQLKKSCDANGGLYNAGSKGSSCIGNGGTVTCDNKGKCTGYVPD